MVSGDLGLLTQMPRKGDGDKEMDNSGRAGLEPPHPGDRFWLLASYERVTGKEGSAEALSFISSR